MLCALFPGEREKAAGTVGSVCDQGAASRNASWGLCHSHLAWEKEASATCELDPARFTPPIWLAPPWGSCISGQAGLLHRPPKPLFTCRFYFLVHAKGQVAVSLCITRVLCSGRHVTRQSIDNGISRWRPRVCSRLPGLGGGGHLKRRPLAPQNIRPKHLAYACQCREGCKEASFIRPLWKWAITAVSVVP